MLILAQEQARLLGHSFIGTEHVLLGLIEEGDGVAAKALDSLGIPLEAVQAKVEETIGPPGSASSGAPPFTPRAKKVLELSFREALQLGHKHIGPEHILLGLVREGEGVAAQVLISLGADLSRVRQEVIRLLGLQAVTQAERVHAGGDATAVGSSGSHRGRRGQGAPAGDDSVLVPGDTWSVRIVRTGRDPAVFAEAYDALAALAARLGVNLDEERILVASVQTTEGAGLSVTMENSLAGGAGLSVSQEAQPDDQPDS